MTGAQEPWGGGERRSLLSRVMRQFTPWASRGRRASRAEAAAERADVVTDEALAAADVAHREARRVIREARDVSASYRAADERLGRMSGRR